MAMQGWVKFLTDFDQHTRVLSIAWLEKKTYPFINFILSNSVHYEINEKGLE